MKKVLCLIMALGLLFAMAGCSETKTLHCDNCGEEFTVKGNSNVEEYWGVYCDECNEELFDGKLVPEE